MLLSVNSFSTTQYHNIRETSKEIINNPNNILSLDPSAFSVVVNYSLFFVMMNLNKKSKKRRKKVRENSSCFVFVVDVSQVQIRQIPAFS